MSDQLLISVVVSCLLGALTLTRWPAYWVFLGSMLACYFMGLIDTETVLSKATNEGLITLILLLLVSVGLERLPWLSVMSSKLVVPSLPRSMLRVSLVATLFSAVVNNTAVVATLAGMLCKNRLHAASKLLLPLSYAAILGGTLTLIGTSTNLIVSSFYQDSTGVGLEFFAFLPIGFPAALGGISVLLLLRGNLPDYGCDHMKVDEYLIESKVQPHSKLIGKSIQNNGLRDLGGLFLVEIVRGDDLLSPVSPSQKIEAGDKLIFSGDISAVGKLERFHGLQMFAVEEGLLSANMTEVVVMPNATITGQTIKESSFRSRFDAAIVGIKRDGERLSGKLGTIKLQAGDSLVLAVGADFSQRMNLRRNFLVVDSAVDTANLSFGVSAYLSVALVVMITLSAMGVFSLIKGLALVLVSMLVLGVVTGADLRRRFPFEVWLIITSALSLSHAMGSTGFVMSVIGFLEPLLQAVSPLWALVAVYFFTLLLSELMTNNAAAAIMFPLAYTLALTSGSDSMAFVMAVAFGASASFITPFGYTTNLMVQNLGGYKRKDYFRVGLPVSLVYSSIVLLLLPLVYPL